MLALYTQLKRHTITPSHHHTITPPRRHAITPFALQVLQRMPGTQTRAHMLDTRTFLAVGERRHEQERKWQGLTRTPAHAHPRTHTRARTRTAWYCCGRPVSAFTVLYLNTPHPPPPLHHHHHHPTTRAFFPAVQLDADFMIGLLHDNPVRVVTYKRPVETHPTPPP